MRRLVTMKQQTEDLRSVYSGGGVLPPYQFNPDSNNEYDQDTGLEPPDITDPWVRKTRDPEDIDYWNKFNNDHPKTSAAAPPMSEDNLDNIPEDPEYWEEFNRKKRLGARSITPSARMDWRRDPIIDGFKTSKLDAVFSCNCGNKFSPTGMYRCACGQSWASFVIGASNDKEAGKEVRIVRPVNEFRDRVLADRRTGSRVIVGDGLPTFVRNASGEDSAPTILDEAEPRKTAAGGFGTITTPGFAPDSDQLATTDPASAAVPSTATTPAVPATTATPAVVPHVTPATPPPVLPVAKRTPSYRTQTPAVQSNKKKETMTTVTASFDEQDYRLGWALAASDSPLPKATLSRSFLGGYAECLQQEVLAPKTADYAPDYGAVDKCFDGETQGVGDVMDHGKNIADPTKIVRKDLGDKLDKDNNEGQHQSDDVMNDLSGWKTSALLREIERRTKK